MAGALFIEGTRKHRTLRCPQVGQGLYGGMSGHGRPSRHPDLCFLLAHAVLRTGLRNEVEACTDVLHVIQVLLHGYSVCLETQSIDNLAQWRGGVNMQCRGFSNRLATAAAEKNRCAPADARRALLFFQDCPTQPSCAKCSRDADTPHDEQM